VTGDIKRENDQLVFFDAVPFDVESLIIAVIRDLRCYWNCGLLMADGCYHVVVIVIVVVGCGAGLVPEPETRFVGAFRGNRNCFVGE
jgi:hypothetical protein